MAYVDPVSNEAIFALLTDNEFGLKAIKAGLTAQQPVPPVGTQPYPSSVQEFIDRYTPSAPLNTSKRPPLGASPSPADVIRYAKDGFATTGVYIGGPTCKLGVDPTPEQEAARAIVLIARNTKDYYTDFGSGLVDSDVLAVLVKTGMCGSEAFWRGSMVTSTVQSRFRDVDFPTFCKGITSNGNPSGG
jgi:hypothetical protein